MFKKDYIYKDGIYVYPSNDETLDKIQDFYRDDPFPNYEHDDDRSRIQQRGDSNSYTYELKKFIDFNSHAELFINELNKSEKKKELNNNEIELIQK